MSDKGAKEEPKPSIWPLVAMMMLTLWMCNRPADPKNNLTLCGTHLHKIGVDLEKFRFTSEDGLYPAKLEDAYGQNPLPACPEGGKSSYIEGYKPSADRKSYVLVCKGDHHVKANVPSDYPRIAFGPAEGTEHSQVNEPATNPSPGVSASPQVSATPNLSPNPQTSASPKATASPKVAPAAQKSPQQKAQGASQSPSPKSSPSHS